MEPQIEYNEDSNTFVLDNGIAIMELTSIEMDAILRKYKEHLAKLQREANEQDPKYYGGL